jgi:uncharacterized RDD family membrane protein YckC
MSNEPFANQPGDQTPDWGQDPTPGAVTRAASVGKRVGAYIIDAIGLAIVVAILLSVSQLGGGVTAMGTGRGYVGNLITAVIFLAYFGLMEAGSGQTLGKKMLGIKAVSVDGSPLTLQAALVRRLPFVIGSIIPTAIGGLVGFVLVLVILITAIQDDPEHRGLHDKWAGSKVIEA